MFVNVLWYLSEREGQACFLLLKAVFEILNLLISHEKSKLQPIISAAGDRKRVV